MRSKKSSVLVALSVGLSLIAQAQAGSSSARRAIVIGGACEFGTINSFFQETTLGSAVLKSHGWDVRILYAGAKARCGSAGAPCPKNMVQEQWTLGAFSQMANQSPDLIKEATRAELYQALDSACTEMPSGSEVLFLYNGHGGPLYAHMGHALCLEPAPGSASVIDTLDTTEAAYQTKLACIHDKGIKLAVIDDSCYGGASVASAAKYGCVLSGTTANREDHDITYTSPGSPPYVTYEGNSISSNLIQLLKFQKPGYLKSIAENGVTLDTVFKRALGEAQLGPDFPQTSAFMPEMYEPTNALAQLHEQLFSALSDQAFMTSAATNHAVDFSPVTQFASSASSEISSFSQGPLAQILWSLPDRAAAPKLDSSRIFSTLEQNENHFQNEVNQIRQIGPSHHDQWVNARYQVMADFNNWVDQARLFQYLSLTSSIGAQDPGFDACSRFVLAN